MLFVYCAAVRIKEAGVKLSLYTSVRDGLYFDYHIVEMIRHHLPLADEIIVHDGNSTDGTFEAISKISPKVRIIRSDWGPPSDFGWISSFKNVARDLAGGDWCINIDCDEFIPEWEFESLRGFLSTTSLDVVPLKQINFYGNYKVYHAFPENVPWPSVKHNIHRNLPNLRVVGDGSNVGFVQEGVDLLNIGSSSDAMFTCHHFGFVRNPARLREKWRNILGNIYAKHFGGTPKNLSIPAFVFDIFPHKWLDRQFLSDLRLYDGKYIGPVRDNPDEFVRDKYKTYDHLRVRLRANNESDV